MKTKYLSNFKKSSRSIRSSKRVGRGIGSGVGGHTVGKGMKGQKSRSGGKTPIWFEGGQTPLVRRMPYKRGFVNINKKDVQIINVDRFEKLDIKGKTIIPQLLAQKGIVKNVKGLKVKILGKGSVTKKVILKGFLYSKTAKEKIETAGGKAN